MAEDQHNQKSQEDTSSQTQKANQETSQNSTENTSGNSQNVGMAIVGAIPILFWVPLVADYKNDEFVMFHAKQGLVLLLYGIITQVASFVLVFIPILGWLAMFILYIFGLISFIMGIINAAQGKKKELPIIGKYGKQFDF